jgi:hypothetical protein
MLDSVMIHSIAKNDILSNPHSFVSLLELLADKPDEISTGHHPVCLVSTNQNTGMEQQWSPGPSRRGESQRHSREGLNHSKSLGFLACSNAASCSGVQPGPTPEENGDHRTVETETH